MRENPQLFHDLCTSSTKVETINSPAKHRSVTFGVTPHINSDPTCVHHHYGIDEVLRDYVTKHGNTYGYTEREC